MSAENIWTVEARLNVPDAMWTKWSSWVDRATAESEKQVAMDEGFQARIVRAA